MKSRTVTLAREDTICTAERLLGLLPSDVIARYAEKHPELSLKEVASHQRELVRFLLLGSVSEDDLVPSIPVDEAWHNFVLFTPLYGPWCKKHLGKFIHHVPSVGEESQGETATFKKTAELMRSLGGEPSLWPIDLNDSEPCKTCTARCKPGKCSPNCINPGIRPQVGADVYVQAVA